MDLFCKKQLAVMMSYLWFHRPDIVGGKHSCLVTDAAAPPLSFSLCHHDNIPLDKRQVARLWALVCVQGHVLWLRQTEGLRPFEVCK